MLRPIWHFVIGHAITAGKLPPAEDWTEVDFVTPRRVTVDAGREAQQNREDVKAGLKTLTDHFAELGCDIHHELETLARQMVEAELDAEIAREKNHEKQKRSATRMSATWIQSSQAGVGGGGRSYLIGGGPMLTESKKHTSLLREVRDAVRKRQQLKVTGNVEAVLGD